MAFVNPKNKNCDSNESQIKKNQKIKNQIKIVPSNDNTKKKLHTKLWQLIPNQKE